VVTRAELLEIVAITAWCKSKDLRRLRPPRLTRSESIPLTAHRSRSMSSSTRRQALYGHRAPVTGTCA